MLILSPKHREYKRRVLYVNSYGGKQLWNEVRNGEAPTHHLWGCVELAAMGYEVALAEPLGYFSASLRRPRIVQDFPLISTVREWLGTEGIVYAGHTVLYWIPFLRRLRALKTPLVSLCFAGEKLDHAAVHSGIIAMTPVAERLAKARAPNSRVAHLGWGVDLDFFPENPICRGDRFLSCGIANRDFATLAEASRESKRKFDVICPGLRSGLEWGPKTEVYDGGEGWNIDQRKKFTFREILDRFYPTALSSIVLLNPDAQQYTANGFTNLLESMAMGKASIFTKTGAIPEEIDIETHNCGLFVEPSSPQSVVNAVEILSMEQARAEEMGQAGRLLCEKHYNILRFSRDLDKFFASV